MQKENNYAIINVHNQDNYTLFLLCSIIILSGSPIQYPDNFCFYLFALQTKSTC